MREILAFVGFIIFLSIGGQFLDLWSFSYFAPKYENARREVYENTKSYNQGKIQQLVKYRFEYMKGSEQDKKIIASTIRHMFADYDQYKLPYELNEFLNTVNNK